MLAARVIWASVRPCVLFIACPSLARSSHDMPLLRLNSSVRRTVGARRLTALVSSISSTSGVRSIRCGIPSTLAVTTVPLTSWER